VTKQRVEDTRVQKNGEKMTDITDKLREERESLDMQEFKQRVEEFINACSIDSETQYHLRNNLGVMINLPYYKESKGMRPKRPYDHLKIILNFCKYLIQYNNEDFTKKLLRLLTINQLQSFRKVAKQKKDINKLSRKEAKWEHIIPAKVVRDKIVEIIDSKIKQDEKIEEIENVLVIFRKAGQLHITNEDNEKLNKSNYATKMPSDWDWSEEKIFSRYIEANINLDKYL
jgi:hypothetical protein